ncbi:Crp/Fnr family transcriptional regulator [Maribacter algarum]|uniref:Crp/Fnr family transcriptional regulator n=1 Tax=Maribacter algarum (ex Zhang et al. 2020) TaxID=2578118 RepID=A0A5S3PUP4_9FLAO|nr:Crp/Fnr family transcriptional regulator [Maribacter algarum]TMM57912.1 Crp/Fnr family transcriptional regulator [Maribacter algarum]
MNVVDKVDFLQNLKNKILSYNKVDEEHLDYWLQVYRKIELKKGEALVSPGQLVDHFYYVAKGCIYYYKLEDGEQKVLEFYTDDVFFTDLPAYVKGTSSNYYLKASEATMVYAIKKSDAEDSFTKSHQLERFGRLSMQEAFMKIFTRVERLSSKSNEERYLRLLEKRPDLFQRVPQYLIASYLGLTPVGLSKIRKRLGRNQT